MEKNPIIETFKVINIYSLKKQTKSKKLLDEIEQLIQYAAEENYRNCQHIIRKSSTINVAYPELDAFLLSKGLSIDERVILNFD